VKFKIEFNLKKDKLFKVNLVVAGDEVDFDLNKDGTGVVHTIHERKNYLSRKAPKLKGASYRGERLEQVISANIDNLFIINSVINPRFNNKSIDRIIVAGESSHLKINIIVNKIDLGIDEEMNEWIKIYSSIGYNVISCSAKSLIGLEELRKELIKKKNLFWGISGVGKSTILNSLYPELGFKTSEVSLTTSKGRHTTVTSILKKVEEDTFIIDTPGISEIDPYGIKKENLSHYFIDFIPYLKNCRFNTCTHNHEPECGVIDAVEKGQIYEKRFDSYLNLLNTIEEDMIFN
jgi:ribosome biogenesis GTPase